MGKHSKIVIEPPGPKARALIEQDHRYIATATKASPLAVQDAKGGVVTDLDGNTFIDFVSGVSVLNVGFQHPAVVKAVKDQADRLFHYAGTDFYYGVQVELARKLAEVTPGDYGKKVFFSNSGAESNEAAMKLARWRTGRKRFISFIGGFHGRTMGALSLTASKAVQQERHFPAVPGAVHVPYAYCYRCAYGMDPDSCGMHCAKVLEEVYFPSFLPPDEVAALFLEPVQGESGYIVPPKAFAQEISRICREHGILLIDDEVQAGMGRTGKMWAIEHSGVVPDVLCTAKSLGSGVPIAATVLPADMDFGPSAHSNTFGGNLIACAASLATFEVIEDEGLVANAEKMGECLNKRLRELQERFEMIGDVRGAGLMQAIELVKDRRTKEPVEEARNSAIDLCFKRGLVLLGAGQSTIRFMPPLSTDEGIIDEAIDILASALRDAAG